MQRTATAVAETTCITWGTCIPYLHARQSRAQSGEECYSYYTQTFCTTYYYEISGGTVPPGGGGGGGGGTPPGGNPDPWGNPCRARPEDNPCGGSGGWDPIDVDNEDIPEDPCTTAQNAARKMDTIFMMSKADSVLASIPNLATEPKEKGFPIIKKLRINPYDMTDTTVAGYRCGTIQTGTDSSINYSYSLGALEYTAATLHTHPPNGYAAHSAKDIYEFLGGRIGEEPHFLGTFVAAANQSQYAITITNPSQASAFLATQSQNLSGTKWDEESNIGKAFKSATKYFEDKYEGDPNKIHLAYEMAMAAVLNQFNVGITLNKKDANGNFIPIVVKTSQDPRKPKKTVYTQECL